MIVRPFNGKTPVIADSALIADNVYLIGDVTIGENCSIWPGVTIRGDTSSIKIGNNVHIEENSVIHTGTHIEDDVMVGHGCTIEGFIGTGSMLGNTASIMPYGKVGRFCAISAGAVVLEGREIADYSFAVGVPAKVHSQIDPSNREHAMRLASTYINGPKGIAALAQEYRRQGIWARGHG